MEATFDKLQSILRETFQDDDIELHRETTAHDIDGWDSLMHVSLMMNVESAFDVRFTSTEIAMLQSVGELIDLIQTKQEADQSKQEAGCKV